MQPPFCYFNFKSTKSDLELLTYPDFCTLQECNNLCEAIDSLSKPSVHLDLASAEARPQVQFRKSNTLVLHPCDALCSSIITRMANVLNLSFAQAEPPNIIKYQVGDYFRPHVDGFSPIHFALSHTSTLERFKELNYSGNRTWTLMLYLNDDYVGGHTLFPLVHLAFTPKPGLLVGWKNTHLNKVIPESLHESTEIMSGHKYVLVVPFRVHACNHESSSYYL